MNFDGAELDALARAIAARLAPQALMDAADVAAMIACDARYVTEQYAKAAGFPKAIRLRGPGDRRSQPRWSREDIVAWIQSHKESRNPVGGRPRRKPEVI
jgi:predicted DNA-binding transcriptional regulator AlpA